MIIRLPIDIKSLYYNIKNDNEFGHTATVATPLRQYGTWHEDLMQIFDIPENINPISRENVISKIISKSRVGARINNIYVFDKLSVNGMKLSNVPSFCIYVREEIDPDNVHCGRQKIHYPTTFRYSDSEIEIDNRTIIKCISEMLKNYAFVVEAFEYNVDSGELNFDVAIVGANKIPYSKVFINRKGVGNKFTSVFHEEIDTYDMEIIALREKLGFNNVGPENYINLVSANTSCALDMVLEYLYNKGIKEIRHFADDYPYALYDYEYAEDGLKKYVIVSQTATKIKYFNLPISKVQFCNDFPDSVEIILITDINGSPKLFRYTSDLLKKMNKSINSIMFHDSEAV